jgi:RimJ/RimL family protein N-acetyltransferase
LGLVLELAKEEQAEEICSLVNLAYRGDTGWTRETDLVSGDRTTIDEVRRYLQDEKAHLLVVNAGDRIKTCICIEQENDCAYIGYFAVHPGEQGRGVGKEVLALAENYALTELNLKKYVMLVVSQRKELISYYESQGYVRTGDIEKYPVHLNVGIPKENGLTIERLEKSHHHAL